MSKRKPEPSPSLPLGGDNAIQLRQCSKCSLVARPHIGLMPPHNVRRGFRQPVTCPGSGKPPRAEE